MTASNGLVCFMLWTLPEAAIGILCDCLVGTVPYTLRATTNPVVQSLGSPRTDDLTRPPGGGSETIHGRFCCAESYSSFHSSKCASSFALPRENFLGRQTVCFPLFMFVFFPSFFFIVFFQSVVIFFVFFLQDVSEHEEDIRLMKGELEVAQRREKEADVVLKVSAWAGQQ